MLQGGGGTDTLAVNSISTGITGSVNRATGFEVLESLGNTGSINVDTFTSIDTFVFSGQTSNGNRLSASGVTSDDLFIFTDDVSRPNELMRFEAKSVGQSLTFEMRASAEDGGQIEFVSTGNSTSSNPAVNFTGNTSFDEVTIISSGTNEDANLIRSVESSGNNYFAFGNEDGPSNFNITGGQALTITAAQGVQLTASDDESGFESSVNLDGSAATGDLRIAGSNVDDAIRGGSGDDILYGLGGDDILTGNGGADQFRFSDHSGSDEILDFTAGTDKIGLQEVNFQNTTASAEGRTLNSADYVDNLLTVANLSGADSNKVVELQNAATLTQITETTVGAQDTYLLVFNQTSGRGELWFDSDWSTTSGGRQMVAEFDNITDLVGLTGLSNTDFVEYTF